tara:strand:- start:851 stop:2098 length:1248 start_codon:yes stop_codon:yes gene_type:complete
MADKNLIAGAAALARSESMLGSALGAGLTQEATRIADDIIKKENERQAQVKNDMNLAAQFIGKMASTGTAAGQYRDILTQEGIKTKNRLNEIALDQSLNAVEKAAEYTKAVDEYNTLATTYGGDQEKLVNLQGIVRAGNYSNTVNRNTEEFEVARKLGTGDYEILKDGYLVNGKKITSAELDQYIQLYKPKNMEGFAQLDSGIRDNIRKAKGNKSYEESVLSEVKNIPLEQKLNYLVDYKGQAYSNFVNENNELNEDQINTIFNNQMDTLRSESAVASLVETKEDDASIGIQYYNLLKENLTDETKLLPFLSRFGISEGAEIDDSLIKSVERAGNGVKIILEKDGETIEDNKNSSELLNLILNNVALTASQGQQLQLKLLQEPIELGEFKKKTPVEKFLNNLGSINIRNPFIRNN